MFKFVHKNQKKMMALFGVLLMITFVAGYSVNKGGGGGGGRTDRVVGTIGAVKVYASELARANAEWKLLLATKFYDSNNPRASYNQPLAVGLLSGATEWPITSLQAYYEYEQKIQYGQRMAGEINSNPNTFYLLVFEARQQGFTASEDAIKEVLDNYLAIPASPDDDLLHEAIADLLVVRQSLDRVDDAVKVSEPMVRRAMALGKQSVSVRIVTIPASEYLSRAKAPTTQDVQLQYNFFGSRLPDQWNAPQTDDPFCFGYAVPDRVQFQYIELKRDQVFDAVKASRKDDDWQNEAFNEFLSRREYYDQLPIALPATQPATQPAPAAHALASTQPLITAPTTSPVEYGPSKAADINADYLLHWRLAMKNVYDRETDKLMNTVIEKINSQMRTDFANFHNAQIARMTPPITTFGVAYDAAEYVPRLVDSIDAQFKLRLGYATFNQWKTAKDLDEIAGIGSAVEDRGEGREPRKFGEYATTDAEPFLQGADKKNPNPLQSWAPSDLLTTADPLTGQTNALYLFRLTATDPLHAPPLASVRQRIETDLLLSSAYDLAKEDARKIYNAAKTDGLQAAATPKRTVQITGLIASPSGEPTAPISPLTLKPESDAALALAAVKLVTALSDSGRSPVGLVDLYPDATAAVIELKDIKPDWTDSTESVTQAEESRAAAFAIQSQLELLRCKPDNVIQRIGYKAAENAP